MVGLSFALAGVVSIVTGGRLYQLATHLNDVGVKTKAIVHSIEKPTLNGWFRFGAFTHKQAPKVIVCFRNADGKWLAGRLKGKELLTLSVRDELNIIYDPANSDDCMLYDTGNKFITPVIMILTGLGSLGYGICQFLLP